jgi:hypothetical protein
MKDTPCDLVSFGKLDLKCTKEKSSEAILKLKKYLEEQLWQDDFIKKAIYNLENN